MSVLWRVVKFILLTYLSVTKADCLQWMGLNLVTTFVGSVMCGSLGQCHLIQAWVCCYVHVIATCQWFAPNYISMFIDNV